MRAADRPRRVTVSLAAFVLICFFLPWVEVSCAEVKRDLVSGYTLAQAGDALLWLVPCFMIVILLFGLRRSIWDRLPAVFALMSMVGGGISAYLMLRERSTTNSAPRIIATAWTPLFWAAVAASIGLAVTALVFYARRSRSP